MVAATHQLAAAATERDPSRAVLQPEHHETVRLLQQVGDLKERLAENSQYQEIEKSMDRNHLPAFRVLLVGRANRPIT